jgi:hypothetical protein
LHIGCKKKIKYFPGDDKIHKQEDKREQGCGWSRGVDGAGVWMLQKLAWKR